MDAVDRLRSAGEYVESLRLSIHERELPATERVRAAAACFAIAQDHHHAIVVLLESRLNASAFALVRPALEAFVRGEWLFRCANDEEVAAFLADKEPPTIGTMLRTLEATPAFKEQVLSHFKRDHWGAMCSYTHTGGLHVQRWNTPEAVEPNYDSSEIAAVLFFAEMIATLSVLGFANIAEDGALAEKVLEVFSARVQ